jgi:tetratricopeptide (TPR) repeat protein
LSALLFACAVLRGGGDITQGRQALLEGNYQLALGLFRDADQVDPNYTYGAELREGVLSFLGRAQYLTGNYAQARQTLEKDLSHHRSDNVARLYLGLTLYRLGEHQAGLTNIQRGMNGIYNWLEYLNTNFALEFGQGWDPSGTIRAGIKSDLDMISSGKIDWSQLITDGEALGIAIEQEEDDFQVLGLGWRKNFRAKSSGLTLGDLICRMILGHPNNVPVIRQLNIVVSWILSDF